MFIIFLTFINLNFLIFFSIPYVLIILVKIICILIAIAYFTIAERKVMASIQRRMGPNIEGGPFGLIQPIADGLKLLSKELIIPSHANIIIFIFSPLLIFILSMTGWSIIPFSIVLIYSNELNFFDMLNIFGLIENFLIANNTYGVLFLLALSSLNVYGIILGGWASNSKYAFLGALRSASQMISYEVSIGLTILPVIFLVGSFNLTEIILVQGETVFFFFPLLPNFIIFFVSMLAETNRAPFDLPEAEAELVAGYNVEYGSMAFALYFLGEYGNMLLMSTLITILFFGGWYFPFFFYPLTIFIFVIKIVFFSFGFIIVRAAFPRYRYDQLMDIGWKIFLPFTLAFLIFIASILLTFNLSQNLFF